MRIASQCRTVLGCSRSTIRKDKNCSDPFLIPGDALPKGIVRSPLTLAAAVEPLVEDLSIRKLAPASEGVPGRLAAISARLPGHDGAWTVAELTGPVVGVP